MEARGTHTQVTDANGHWHPYRLGLWTADHPGTRFCRSAAPSVCRSLGPAALPRKGPKYVVLSTK